jgi:hypothetical protein
LKIEIKSFTPAQSVHEESEATGAKSKGRRKTKPAS